MDEPALAGGPTAIDTTYQRVHNGAYTLQKGGAMPKLSEFLTIGQAASYLGVSRDTLRRWDRSGKLTARRHPLTEFRLYLKRDLDIVLAPLSKPAAKDGKTERVKGKNLARPVRRPAM